MLSVLLLAVAVPVAGLGALAAGAAPVRPQPQEPGAARAAAARVATSAPTRQEVERQVEPPAPRRTARAVGGAGAAVVVARGDGALRPVEGTGRRRGSGPLQRYTVAVEGGLGVDPRAFARAVEATLADPRSWGAGGRLAFQRVDAGPVAFRVVLASPATTDRLCAPLRTAGTYSCASRGAAVVNARRWLRGAPAYRGALVAYRQYVVNHEVGHVLGHGHESCPGAGRLAPVMLQQTKGVGACRPNAWPYP